MQNSERQIALIRNVDYRFRIFENLGVRADFELSGNSNIMIMKFDLYITDKRMVWDYRNSHPFSWSSAIKSAIRKTSGPEGKQTKEHFMGFMALDELLKRNKENFEIRYEDVKEIRLHKSFKYGMKLHVETEKTLKEFGLNKQQFRQLLNMLPNIDALKGKLSFED